MVTIESCYTFDTQTLKFDIWGTCEVTVVQYVVDYYCFLFDQGKHSWLLHVADEDDVYSVFHFTRGGLLLVNGSNTNLMPFIKGE